MRLSDEVLERLQSAVPTRELRERRWQEYLHSDLTRKIVLLAHGCDVSVLSKGILSQIRYVFESSFLAFVMPGDVVEACESVPEPRSQVVCDLLVGSLAAPKTKRDGSPNTVMVTASQLIQLLDSIPTDGG